MSISSKAKKHLIKFWYLVIAILFYALALNLFLAGNRIAAGGLSGLAIALTTVIPISIGTFIFVANIPLLIISVCFKGWAFTRNAIIGSVIFPLVVDTTAWLPTLTSNPLVAAVFGGVMYGIGMAYLVKANSSTGGTDLINRLVLSKFRTLSLGKISMVIDGFIVILAMIVYGEIEVGLYAIITLAVSSLTADRILLGFDRGNLCFIITAQEPLAMADILITKLHHTVTQIAGTGMYSGNERSILLTVVRPAETLKLKDMVSEIDPNAFIIVTQANEVLGGSFKLRSPE